MVLLDFVRLTLPFCCPFHGKITMLHKELLPSAPKSVGVINNECVKLYSKMTGKCGWKCKKRKYETKLVKMNLNYTRFQNGKILPVAFVSSLFSISRQSMNFNGEPAPLLLIGLKPQLLCYETTFYKREMQTGTRNVNLLIRIWRRSRQLLLIFSLVLVTARTCSFRALFSNPVL